MSYGFKLVCVSVAAFFIVHGAAGLVARWFTPASIRAAGGMRASSAARFLLMLRLAPVGIASLAVMAFCIPSYLRFEPELDAERVGPVCLFTAALSVAVWTISVTRAFHAIYAARKPTGLTIALAGLLRPRVVVSDEVRAVLSLEELDAAVRHEYAHATSRDNLKRLLILITPDPLPFYRGGLASVDRAWKKFAEWSADDQAAGDDASRAVALASALVRVARLNSAASRYELVTSLIEDDLEARVNRLLSNTRQGTRDRWTPAFCAVSAIALITAILRPGALVAVHAMLERLMQ